MTTLEIILITSISVSGITMSIYHLIKSIKFKKESKSEELQFYINGEPVDMRFFDYGNAIETEMCVHDSGIISGKIGSATISHSNMSVEEFDELAKDLEYEQRAMQQN